MELLTKRLRLRSLEKKDYTAVHSYSSDPENVKYMTFGPNSPKDTRRFIKGSIEESKDIPRTKYDFVIEKLDTWKVIGACSIYIRDDVHAEIGWILNKNYWNMNYTTEAARALIHFGFSVLKLHRIFARCNSENIGSWRVMEKCAMQKEACFRQVRKLRSEQHDPNSRWYDEYQYSILAEEYTGTNER
ncbi:MAG: GNAT family N-acetyltransferase [Oscillospiraceae bacterium]|nr:GNAT family N-acetyltransferase [Oscillospiraceae bacterium]